MKGRHTPLTTLTAVLILSVIIVAALVVWSFDRLYFGPVCRRYGEANNMVFVSVSGGRRNGGLRCTFDLYHADGTFRARVDIPLSRVDKTPAETLASSLRWLILPILVLPAVWIGSRVLKHHNDDDE
jgi:hypothetical protein